MEIHDTFQPIGDTSWDLPIPLVTQGQPRLLTPEDEAYIRNYPAKTQLHVGENRGYPDLVDLDYMAVFERMQRHLDEGFVSDAISDGVHLVTKYSTWPRGLIRLAAAYTAANTESYRTVAKQLLDRALSIVEAHMANELPAPLIAPTAHPASKTDLQTVLQSIYLNLGDYWIWHGDYDEAVTAFESGIAIDQPNYQIPLGVYKSYTLIKLGRMEDARLLYSEVSGREGADAITNFAEHVYPELRQIRGSGGL